MVGARQRVCARGLLITFFCWLCHPAASPSFTLGPSRASRATRSKVVRPAVAQEGLLAKVKLAGKLKPSDPYQNTDGGDTLDFIIGERYLLAGLDNAVIGMKPGETKEVQIAPHEARGHLLSDMVVDVPMEALPPGAKPGARIDIPNGKATIIAVDNEVVSVKMGHPWVGNPLSLKVTLVDCTEVPKEQRIEHRMTSAGDAKTFPKPGDSVTIHFERKDKKGGKIVESSRFDGEPLTFTVGEEGIDPGWERGIMRMSLGECALIKIPAAATGGMRTDKDTRMRVEVIAINGKKFDIATQCKKSKPVLTDESMDWEKF